MSGAEPSPRILWQEELGLDHGGLTAFLRRCGEILPGRPQLAAEAGDYAQKLLDRAEIAFAREDGQTLGLVALYANDRERRRAYVPLVAVDPQEQGRGIGRALMARAIARARARGMTALEVHTDAEAACARAFHAAVGLREMPPTPGGEPQRLRYRIGLPEAPDPALIAPTPLESRPELAALFGLEVDLRVKRDDLHPRFGGGTKARKMVHILRAAVRDEYDVIVTNGAATSNHLRAAALGAAELGLACHGLVVREDGAGRVASANLSLARLSGARLETCAKADLAARMDAVVAAYARQGRRPLYVWGGGQGLMGTASLVTAAAEVQTQGGGWQPDWVVLACGTGSSQAGLALGFAGGPTRVIGVSIARSAARGMAALRSHVARWRESTDGPEPELRLTDRWTGGGYGRVDPSLLAVVRQAARRGLLLDPTYSGKGWQGLVGLVREGTIPAGSRVLFWHTGGGQVPDPGDIGGADE